jgi:DNA polymerase III sliding clamp (beta) subunit (PCNA family)
MKIQVRVKQLAEVLHHIQLAIAPVEYALAPSNHVYMVAKENIVKILGTNGTDLVQVILPAKVEKAGNLTLPLEQLKHIASYAPSDKILSLEAPKHEICKFSIYPSIKGRLDSHCQIPDFPSFTDNKKLIFQTTERILKNCLEDVLPFAGQGQIERVWQSCIAIRKTQNKDIELASGSNGTMTYSILPIANSLSGDILLFAPSIRRLARLLDSTERPVLCSLQEEDQMVIFDVPRVNTRFVTRIQNDPFPDVAAYFPKEYEVDIAVSSEDLKSALHLVKPYSSQDGETVTLKINENQTLFAEASRQSLGEVSVAIKCRIIHAPQTFQMKINSKRLMAVIANIDTEDVRFQIRIRNNHLLVITPENETGNRTLKYAIMP